MALQKLTFQLSKEVALEMLPIPAGSFLMGSPQGELGRNSDERQHPVTLTQDFWLGKYAVTQKQYLTVMGRNPAFLKTGESHPVEQVSWYMAMEYCEKLNQLLSGQLPDGYLFSLPTEAQWEYACRAGHDTALYTGKNLSNKEVSQDLDSLAWYRGNSVEQGHQDVGTKQPNAFGLYDMLGNVHEWVSDCYGRYPDEAVDPEGPTFGGEKVCRGGAWMSSAWKCRAARRGVDPPSYALRGNGFRLALRRK